MKIFGTDYDELERLGSEVKEVLEQIPGTREGEGEVEYETTGRAPMLEIRVKRDVLAKYNLHAGDVNQTIAAALGGQTVGTMIEGNRRFDIVVRLNEADRENLETIRALPVRVGEAGMLPLGAVADIERVKTVSPILRDSAQRRAALMVNLRGRDVESWVREADTKVREHVQLPSGYTLEFGGQFENLREAKARLAIVVPAALAFIFVLIFMAFGSVRQALLVYTGVPARSYRRRCRAMAARYAVQHLRCRGIHRFERRRGSEWSCDDQLFQSIARRRSRCAFCGGRRIVNASAASSDDCGCSSLRLHPDGSLDQCGRGSATAIGHGGDRRNY